GRYEICNAMTTGPLVAARKSSRVRFRPRPEAYPRVNRLEPASRNAVRTGSPDTASISNPYDTNSEAIHHNRVDTRTTGASQASAVSRVSYPLNVVSRSSTHRRLRHSVRVTSEPRPRGLTTLRRTLPAVSNSSAPPMRP